MAKKVETVSLIDTFSEFKELKNIDISTWLRSLVMASSLPRSTWLLTHSQRALKLPSRLLVVRLRKSNKVSVNEKDY